MNSFKFNLSVGGKEISDIEIKGVWYWLLVAYAAVGMFWPVMMFL